MVAVFSWGGICVSGADARVCKRKSKNAITAQAVYVADAASGKVLFSCNSRGKFFPASTVKLLTALVILDTMDLTERVTVSRRATHVTPTKAGLTRGATYSVEDLLKVLLATSANDAGVALAEAAAGSEEKFASLMNKKARALGARGSYFTNATGLPDKRQVTTAYDLSLIARAAFNSSFIASVMRRKTIVITGSDGKRIARSNHNKFLWTLPSPTVLGKTGYTRSARHCYAGVAYYEKRRVCLVILKSRKPWADLRNILKIVRRK